ncbi:QWxxN domain [Enterococcus mundtii]|uniref:QWxxN domain n=1 Tax=Enterococcus mundtii TaxID=53346 RepID=UPI0008263185|nr:QWxxN domain [Enterococcus mundtii]
MPIEEHRKAVGTFENKRNKKSDQNARQQAVNFISNTANNQLTERIRWSPLLFLQLLVITDSLAVRGEPPRTLRTSRLAFEADTYVDIGPAKTDVNHIMMDQTPTNQTRIYQPTIHSLSFRSSVNTTLVQPAQPINASEYLSDPVKNATLQEPVSLAEFTHHWTLHIHKTIHNLEKIDKCNTTVTPMSVLEYGLWEKKNHTLYHFNTICEEAKSKSLQLREQAKDDQQEIHHFSFKNKDSKNKVDLGKIQLEAKNIARMVLSSYYDYEGEPSSSHSENNHTRPFLPTSFLENLTDTFTSFFHEYQNTSHTTGSGEPPVESVLSKFFTVLTRTFSAEHLATEHVHKESSRGAGAAYFPQAPQESKNERPKASKSHQTQTTKNDQATDRPILEEEEEHLAAPLLELAKKFNERIDQFFEKINFQILPGAEALPTPQKNLNVPILPYASSMSVSMNYLEDEPSLEIQKTVNKVMKRYINIEPSLPITTKFLTPFWFHLVLFQKRHNVGVAMETIRKSLCELSDDVCFSNSVSTKELFHALYNWGTSKDPSDQELVLERRRQIAQIILEAYGVKDEQISDIQAIKIFLQARNNHAFMNYKFQLPDTLNQVTPRIDTPAASADVPPYDASKIPLNSVKEITQTTRAFINQRVDMYTKGQPLPMPKTEAIDAFWLDLDVFQQRVETEVATNRIKERVCEYLGFCLIDDLSTKDFFLALLKWVDNDISSVAILEKRRQVAKVILQSYDINDDTISDDRAIAIFFQWIYNDVFSDIQFNEPSLTDIQHLKSSSPTQKKLLPYDISSQVSLNSSKELSQEEHDVVNKIVTAYLKNQPLLDKPSLTLPPIWFDRELFDRRAETEKVNKQIIEELVDEYEELKGSSRLASNDFSLVLQNFANNAGSSAAIINRRLQIAKTILKEHGLPAHNLSEERSIAIFLQWRYNNAFNGYIFKKEPDHLVQKRAGEHIPGTELYESAKSLQAPLLSYEELTLEVEHELKLRLISYLDIKHLYTNLKLDAVLTPFWFQFEVFKDRYHTETINEAVKEYLANEDGRFRELKGSLIRYIFIELAKLENEESASQSLLRRRKIAHVILHTLGRPATRLSDAEANAIFLQWRANNVYHDAKFLDVKTIPFFESSEYTETATTNQTEKVVPSDLENDLTQIKKVVQAVIENKQPLEADIHDLPNFYFVGSIYQNKQRTANVNKKIRNYLVQQRIVEKLDTPENLIEQVEKWIGKNWQTENSVDAERMQFFAYMILKEYDVPLIRLGEQLSTRKLEAIYMQWKLNTLLEGAIYRSTNEKTTYYKISPDESPYVISKFQQKQESDYIYKKYNKGMVTNTSIFNGKLLVPYVYYLNIFNKVERTFSVDRSKTFSANEIVRRYLRSKNVILKRLQNRYLTQAVENWILSEKRYPLMVVRVYKVANIILSAYNVNEENLTLEKAYAVILQWINNNAQVDFTFDMEHLNFAYGNDEESKKQEMKEKVKAFISENGINKSNKKISDVEIDKFGSSLIQVEETLQKVADFLTSYGHPCSPDDKNNLVKVATHWTLQEGTSTEKVDMNKVRNLLVLFVGIFKVRELSDEEAHQMFLKWAMDTLELAAAPTEVKPAPSRNDRSFVITEAGRWRDKNIRNQIEIFFQQKQLLSTNPSKEELLVALGKWFSQDSAGFVLMNDKTQPIAKIILKEMNRYGGEANEKISEKNAELTVTKWIFETVLESSIEAYVTKNILNAEDPSIFTIGQLRNLFEVDELAKAGVFNLSKTDAKISEDSLSTLKKIWILLVQKTLPNYFLETSQISDDLLISDFGSVIQLVGSKILENVGYRTKFDQTEIRKLGALFCETISTQGITTIDELNHLLMPALITTAQLDPEGLRKAGKEGKYKEYALQTFLGYWNRRDEIRLDIQKEIEKRFSPYQKATINWRRKQAITNDVVQECERLGATFTFGMGEIYLGGGNPCPSLFTPINIEVAYKSLTRAVSDSYFDLDQKIIELSLYSLNMEDQHFIFSPDTTVFLASAKLSNKVHYYGPSAPGSMPMIFFKHDPWLDTILELEQTDLFVANNGKEERIYALKRLADEGGYVIQRVDRDPLLFLEYGLFNNKHLLEEGYSKEGDRIKIGKKLFTFTIDIIKDKKLCQGYDTKPFIDQLARHHSDLLYNIMYELGNDKTVTEKVWNVVKHFIPFYDCVVGIIDQDIGEAVTSCTIDAVMMIPIFGQISALNWKFALGASRALAKGGLKLVIKNTTYFLPSMTDIKVLMKSVARSVDPGFELLVGGANLIIKRLISFKYSSLVTKEMKLLLNKLERFDSATKARLIEEEVLLAKLSKDGPHIFVKRVKDNLFLQVTDIETGDVFGKYYTLHGDQLKPFEGPISFNSEQKELIKHLASTVAVYKSFSDEKNLNPRGYGDGPILAIKKTDLPTEYYIKLNGHVVPVRATIIEGQGIRYDVCNGDKIFPVKYNGIEWGFEPPSSPMVTKEIIETTTKQLQKTETIKDPSTLSPPDENGLMWNAYGKSYLKINDQYVTTVLLDREFNRYGILNKSGNDLLTILRFDLENNSFRLETSEEKRLYELEKSIRRAGKKEIPSHDLPGTSNAGTSAGASSAQTTTTTKEPDYSIFPKNPGREKEWNMIRDAIPYFEIDAIRFVDHSVQLPPLDALIPLPRNRVRIDAEKNLLSDLAEIVQLYLPKTPELPYKVYSGLEPSKLPASLRPFAKKFIEEVQETTAIFETYIKLAEFWLSHDKIEDTDAAKLFMPLFELQNVENKEEIMRAALKRLLFISKKGLQFVEQSATFGFENIWLISTDLVYQKSTKSYFSQYTTRPRADAFIISNDPNCRILIFADTFHMDSKIDLNRQVRPGIKETFIHEITHTVAGTEDWICYTLPPRGVFMNSLEEIRDSFNKNKDKLIGTPSFQEFVKQAAMCYGLPELSPESVLVSIRTDPFLSANIKLTDAETVMNLIVSLVKGLPFSRAKVQKRETNSMDLGSGYLMMAIALSEIWDFKANEMEIPLENVHTIVNNKTVTATPERATGHREKRGIESIINEGKENSENVNVFGLTGKTENKRNVLDPFGLIRRQKMKKKQRAGQKQSPLNPFGLGGNNDKKMKRSDLNVSQR